MDRSPQCLSWMALDRLATASRAPTAQQSGHLASCPRCALRYHAQCSGVAAAAYTPLPQRLQGTGRVTLAAALPRVPAWVSYAGILGLVVFFSLRPQPGALHVTAHGGEARLRMAVRHDGVIQNLAPRDALRALHAGDEAQVHVQSQMVRWVGLRDADTGDDYYAGPLPPDGWVPVQVRIADNRPLRLQVRLCQGREQTRCDDESLP